MSRYQRVDGVIHSLILFPPPIRSDGDTTVGRAPAESGVQGKGRGGRQRAGWWQHTDGARWVHMKAMDAETVTR